MLNPTRLEQDVTVDLLLIQVKSPATLVVEFMREPFSGIWIGDVGYLSARQIAVGTGVPLKQVRGALRRKGIESKVASGVRVYRLNGPTKAKKVECPVCGDHVEALVQEHVEALVQEQGHEMCHECARFVRISKTKLPPVARRPIVRTINGKSCVPAWSHEPGSFKWEGDGNFYIVLGDASPGAGL